MNEDISERIGYGLDDLPYAPPLGDLSRLYSPAELAMIRTRRAQTRRVDRLSDVPASAIASAAGGLVPGSGIADFFGYYPDFKGGYEPGFSENVRQGNFSAAGLQALGLAGDALYISPPIGAAFAPFVKAPRASQRIGRFSKYAEQYPPVGTPRLIDKATGKEVHVASQPEADELLKQGVVYQRKTLPPETMEFAKERRAIQRDMDEYGYEHYYDPAKRSDVDPANYRTDQNMSIEAVPKQPETQQKYRDAYQTNGAKERLTTAYREGLKVPNAGGTFLLKQLEDDYLRVLGPVEARARFKTEYADAMAAATAGNDPTANFLLAHFFNVLNKQGLKMPKSGAEMPYPVGGAFAARNAQQAQKLFDNPSQGFGAKNPKRHDFSYSMLGYTDKPPIDSVISEAIVPGMRAPRYYGPASELLKILAEQHGVDARHFQDIARTGLQKMKHSATTGADYPFKAEGPLINVKNESIERTHRLTGMPREEIVRRGLVLKDIPAYGLGGTILAPMAGYGLVDSISDNN